ncbi:MAG: permease-like cell division protein FtsX [Negativicutes bacterium]|jgi:cell division transport system permease protein|nr:permease-like cell division protein FtsX [Negativicutes bacterium]MBP8629240.1 permease-like cell division protein FtsX [Negativicutes bacterium]MBP9537530.1 permease-like cell division protein FtsX [Negativicutes bacterium]MBP9949737.1 permease-like cell division protein FtsX [Negativicutes bacterium]
MKIRTLEYFVKEAAISLKRNNLMSFASITTVAISLVILGLFLIMVMNLNNMAAHLESQVQINVYLEDNLSEAERYEIGNNIKKIKGVEEITFVTKDEAIERFRERLGEQKYLLDALDDANPLPYSYEVKLTLPEQVKSAAAEIAEYPGVKTAKFGQEAIEQLFKLTHMIRVFGVVLILFLVFATLFIISNTIRLTVFARRKEIGIMKYVGATDWFIRWPFIMEGMALGFGGALIATLVLRTSYSAITNQIYQSFMFLPLIPQYPFLTNLTILLIVLGMIIGALGSAISLKKFMKV